MRPVRRGASPQQEPFDPYTDAKPVLLSRIGSYCSYCERRIETNLAVEHIQPKGLPQYKTVELEWTNFLLGCVNCNSTKGDRDILLHMNCLPDRDNTFISFEYALDGYVRVSNDLDLPTRTAATNIIEATGLDKRVSQVLDENGKMVVVDRVSKRQEVFGIALDAKDGLERLNNHEEMQRQIVDTAVATGLFSIWMKVFENNPQMRVRLIQAYPGTEQSGCFDMTTGHPVSPHPNADGLAGGGKI